MAALHMGHNVQRVPAGLADVLNGPDDHRDSAYYSSQDPASKHNSTQSTHGHYLSRSNTSTDLTPSPVSAGPHTQALNSPSSGAMSVASIVSPTHYAFSQHPSYDAKNADSRRESVDSRLGNFGDMRLANSPYASANQSTTSLQSTLAQQRNPGSVHPDRNSGPFRLSNGYQPNFQRQPDGPTSVRTAPLITGPALGAIARAPEPTKGQAWAFPDQDVQRPAPPPAPRPTTEDGRSARHGTSFYDDSRRNSYADSIASSQYTTESRLPAGQRRLEEGLPSPEYQRGSSEFQVSTHHHSLQHRQLSDLQNDDGSPTSSQPYSRTPELRVSHKLAERKRRLEMKDLFDNLRILQSVERGAKASKWEILSKAISEHERQAKMIEDQKKQVNRLESKLQRIEHDLDVSRRDASTARQENAQLRAEIASLQNAASSGAYHATPAVASHGRSFPLQAEQQLPPLRNIPQPEVMSGVQYSHDPRANGYRGPSDRF